ncbi:uncharacterized protein C20orf204 homolog isoform 1-T1 [Theristicus caerulescens]
MLNNRVRAAGFAEILPRALSCAVLLLLLVAVLSRGKRCSIAKILRQYRAVIFHEIQNLKNLSGWEGRSGRAGPACRSDKVSTKGPGAGASWGLSPRGAAEPPSPPGAACFSPLLSRTRRSCSPSTTSACPCGRWRPAPCAAPRSWRCGRWPEIPTSCSGRTAGKSARACRASRRSPGTGDPAAGGSSCGRSGGRRRGWRPAGRSSTPCTRPAVPRGTRRDALAMCPRDALLRHRGCRRLVWKPGANSTLKATELLPVGARVEFILPFQAVPRDRPRARSRGWQVGLRWDGCGRKLQHQKRGGEDGEELKKGGEALESCDAPGPASPAAFLGTTVAFWGGKRTRGATVWRAPLEARRLRIRKALRVAGLRRGT